MFQPKTSDMVTTMWRVLSSIKVWHGEKSHFLDFSEKAKEASGKCLSPSTFTRTEFSSEFSGLLGRARQEERRVGGNAREGNTASAPKHFPHRLQAVQWERMRGAISLLEFQQWPRIASKGATVSLTSVWDVSQVCQEMPWWHIFFYCWTTLKYSSNFSVWLKMATGKG